MKKLCLLTAMTLTASATTTANAVTSATEFKRSLLSTSTVTSATKYDLVSIRPVTESAAPLNGRTADTGKTQVERRGVQLIANQDLRSVMEIDGEKVELSGRASIHLSATEEQLAQGIVEVKGFNVAYFKVPQRQISGYRADESETGVLGFALDMTSGKHLLTADGRGHLSGELLGHVDAGFMAVLGRIEGDDKGDEDLYDTPVQLATLIVDVELGESLKALNDKATGQKEAQTAKGGMRFSLAVDAERDFDLPRYQIESAFVDLRIDYVPIIVWLEVAKRLCIQPVRIGRLTWTGGWTPALSVEYTGDGLGFGMPGANTEWAKADVVFSVNDWVTVWKSGYWIMDTAGSLTSAEEADLLDEVDNDECVEVYFVEDFDPESAHGGGATWGSGTAGTKIISSDGNADGGIDLTHLAHELGHSMGLRHPSSAATASAEPGSSGTLMCPSGWMNDNPAVNSQENEDKLSNPLFTFAFKFVSPGPDCTDSADCGSCP